MVYFFFLKQRFSGSLCKIRHFLTFWRNSKRSYTFLFETPKFTLFSYIPSMNLLVSTAWIISLLVHFLDQVCERYKRNKNTNFATPPVYCYYNYFLHPLFTSMRFIPMSLSYELELLPNQWVRMIRFFLTALAHETLRDYSYLNLLIGLECRTCLLQ